MASGKKERRGVSSGARETCFDEGRPPGVLQHYGFFNKNCKSPSASQWWPRSNRARTRATTRWVVVGPTPCCPHSSNGSPARRESLFLFDGSTLLLCGGDHGRRDSSSTDLPKIRLTCAPTICHCSFVQEGPETSQTSLESVRSKAYYYCHCEYYWSVCGCWDESVRECSSPQHTLVSNDNKSRTLQSSHLHPGHSRASSNHSGSVATAASNIAEWWLDTLGRYVRSTIP